ncbi:MAG TPA: hypothetical protein VML75_16985 [Kofleriaceae bacterium]|nr:hypothetical protein [Kofleriaceae bacterium]
MGRLLPAWALALGTLAAACGGGGGPDAGPALPAWQRELPAAVDGFGARRGLSPARGIIHLHSPYSHDACDGEPRPGPNGEIDEACLANLREALCATRVDYAALTEHDASMADEEFETLFLQREGDVLVTGAASTPIASRMTCPNGHTVLFTVGGENDLMPIMLDAHPPGTASERHEVYNAEDAATVALFRSLGGLVWIPHTEQRPIELLRALEPDGIEIYQLHANIDPNIRVDHLGLDSAGAIQAVAEFADTNPTGPEPDLALMAFLEPNQPSIDKWNTLLGEGLRLAGSGGTDAHENSLPITLRDGERGDSYRRMIRWFANVALVSDPSDPEEIQAAIAAGRFFVAFELFGTPSGFDFFAPGAEMGGEVTASTSAAATLALPTVYGLDSSLPAPSIRGRILRIDAGGVTEVAAGETASVTAALDAPGAYRAEVLITPRHYGAYLGHLGTAIAEREQVWVYSNPIYVVP